MTEHRRLSGLRLPEVADEIAGAKRGANAGRRQAKSGDNEPWFPQLTGLSGGAQQHAATPRMRLKAEGRQFDPPLATSSEA